MPNLQTLDWTMDAGRCHQTVDLDIGFYMPSVASAGGARREAGVLRTPETLSERR
jgi:hypothetical protein